MRDAGLPITLIIVGSAWLLWYFRLFPDIDWIIAAGLVAGGGGHFISRRHHQEVHRLRAFSNRERHRLGGSRSLACEVGRVGPGAAHYPRCADAYCAPPEHPGARAAARSDPRESRMIQNGGEA
jgi:hypothetical protein